MSENPIPKKQFDNAKKAELTQLATAMFQHFVEGEVVDSGIEHALGGDQVFSLFGDRAVILLPEYYSARSDFVLKAAKLIKAKAAHEMTIAGMCLKASQNFLLSGGDAASAAKAFVDEVLLEADREYVHIEANFLVAGQCPKEGLTIGRVRVIQTDEAAKIHPMSAGKRVQLASGNYPQMIMSEGGVVSVGMPRMAWIVQVPSTRENVYEESKWLIDVATSLLRFQFNAAGGRFPTLGKIEAHPTRAHLGSIPHVTFEGDTAWTGGSSLSYIYEITDEVEAAVASAKFKKLAEDIFDPAKGSIALRVAQGLGWMTRGRQSADRSERLIAFFTALEALLSSSDKSAPIVQTISRYVSVIYTPDIADRIKVYSQIKALYALRSAVIHSGQRDVLWQDVNALQQFVEAVFRIVLRRCDMTLSQQDFATSLSDASHGSKWKYSPKHL